MEILLHCGKAAATANTLGGELTGYKGPDGNEFIWQGDAASWSGRNPCLFPTVGATKGRKACFNGEEYPLKKHGFARKQTWEVVSQTENSVTFLLKETAETKTMYPYAFNLFCTNTISEKGFSITYTVRNTDTRPLWFGLGGHTGYVCPQPGKEFPDYEIAFKKTEAGPLYYTDLTDCDGVIHYNDRQPQWEGVQTLPLSYDIFNRDVLVFASLASPSLELREKGTKKGLSIRFSGYNALGLWTAPGKNAAFLCVEPWTCLPDFEDATDFENKPLALRLEPGQEYSASTEVTLL